jgi:hypothetical protein
MTGGDVTPLAAPGDPPPAPGHHPDTERLLATWLAHHVGLDVYATGEIPPDEHTLAPFLSVARLGGTGTLGAVGIDKDIDHEVIAWTPDRATLWPLVRRVEAAMAELAANGLDEYVDDVTESFAFGLDDYPNKDLRRALATYTLTVRPSS